MSESTAAGLQVSYYSERSPDHDVNEDLVLAGDQFVIVLDGASHLAGVDTGCIHDVPWLVRQLGAQLVAGLLGSTDPLAEILAGAIERVNHQHADTCDLDNPDSPSSTVAILRRRGDELDYLVLADCSIVFRRHNHSTVVITDDRVDHLPGYTAQIVREQRNSPGGFWVASTDPQAAREALTGTLPIDHGDLQAAALLTDGAAGLVERHGGSWADTMALLEHQGPQRLIEQVREMDESTPHEGRGKRHDDATAALCRFPSSTYGKAQVLRQMKLL